MHTLKRIEGNVVHITFQSEDTGFTVLELETETEYITVVGEMAGIGEGQKLVAFGDYTNHPSFGVQFKAEKVEISLPSDANAIYTYLSSGAVKGIGMVFAKRIVEKFGEDTFDVLDNYPEKLAQVQGISYSKAKAIQQEFKKIHGVQDAVIFLSKYNISAKEAISLYSILGPNTVEIVEDNPFVLCGEPCFFEFERADEIAQKMMMEYDNSCRVEGGIMFVLRHNTLKGHSCVPKQKLIETVSSFISVEPEKVENSLQNLFDQGLLIEEKLYDKAFVFLAELYAAEIVITQKLTELMANEIHNEENINYLIKYIEQINDITYAQKQKEAIEKVYNSPVSIITGGPGTGKTTIVKGIISLFEAQGLKISLCAPTGRAAKRISDLTDKPAKTIHRLLEVMPGSKESLRFSRNQDNPLPCQVLIIDEFSMVDIVLFSQLITAVKPNCRIVLVGDSNQLPAVGPGNILKDLIESDIVPCVMLTEIFRQSQQSQIVVNAHNINNGIAPVSAGKDSDFFFIDADGERAEDLMVQFVTSRLPQAYGYDSFDDIQVLCPSRKKRGGTANINVVLQKSLNPPAANKKEISFNGVIFRECDKVMQIKNNYDLEYVKDDGNGDIGVFNGDIGVIERIDTFNKLMYVRFEDRLYTYTQEEFPQLEHSYAITVHKSQGCEFKAVVLCISDTAKELQYRNLLYTAITRAKELLIIIGKPYILGQMTLNHRKQLRYSGIKYFLEEMNG
ncbi:MAG: ATP-dependent RecD-like DNA helicase [Oscillospiraceae bacterium]|nr:ATP-dependent RecD-like DNA helicase [Oscillospiraceae bacterium]